MSVDVLQAEYDRLIAYRSRVIRYYDDCPDGDPRKWSAECKLRELNSRICDVENRIDKELS